MLLIKNNKRESLFDGFESEVINKTFDISGVNKKLKISIDDFIDNSLEDLLNYVNQSDLNQISSDLNIKKVESLFVKYKSVDNLEIYFCIKEKELFIFSYGETQPMRFELFLEGVYSLN